jgi:hypothetical protein
MGSKSEWCHPVETGFEFEDKSKTLSHLACRPDIFAIQANNMYVIRSKPHLLNVGLSNSESDALLPYIKIQGPEQIG